MLLSFPGSKIRFALLILIFSLAGCGGGSGGGNKLQAGPCGSVTDISLNDTVMGTLATTDCTIQDLVTGVPDDTYVDQYRVTVVTAGTLTIEMLATDVDAYLVLVDSDTNCDGVCAVEQVLAEDDNSAGEPNARIVMALDPGTYIIFANSVVAKTGSYTLTTSFI